MIRVLFFALVCITSIIVSAEERFQFDTEAQRQTYLELVAELRCPKCQNQNIADSNAMISEDMKRKVHELVMSGSSKADIINFMKQRYGEFVHYRPPMTPVTIWLYLLPVVFIIAMGWLVIKGKKAGTETNENTSLEKAEKALKEIE